MGRQRRPLLACVLLAAAGCDGGSQAPAEPVAAPRRERRIDLLARVADAVVVTPSGASAPRLQGDSTLNLDVDAVELEVAPGTRLTFRDVPLHHGAVLQVEVGVRRTDRGVLPPGYHAIVRGTTVAGGSEVLADLALDFAGGERRRSATVDLAARAGRPIDLTFELLATHGGRDEAAWSRLSIESEGREETPADRVTDVETIAADFAAAGPADVAARGTFRFPLPGGWERPLVAPPRSRLRFGLALRAAPAGAAATFRVVVDGATVATFTRAGGLDPAQVGGERHEIDLAPFAGREARVRIEAEPAAGTTAAVAAAATAELFQPQLVATREIARARRDARSRDLFLIVVDTLRADALGCFGGPPDASPRLDDLAASSVLFERCHAPSSWTVPTTATLLTGLPPETHGVLGPGTVFLLDAHDTLAEQLRREGYATGGFVANTLLTRAAQFDQGFEEWQTLPWVNARKIVARALQWLDDHPTERVFAYLHLVDPHAPYNAPLAEAERTKSAGNRFDGLDFRAVTDQFRDEADEQVLARVDDADVREAVARVGDLYQDEVRYADRWIGVFLDELRRRGRFDDAVVVVTADHGEEFLEHRRLFHGAHLYDESVRVPLLLHAPGLAPARHRELFGTPGLAPLLRSLASAAAEGRDPDALVAASFPASVSAATGISPGDEHVVPLRSIVRGAMKLIVTEGTTRRELYDLRADPREQRNLADLRPETVAELTELLEKELAAERASALGGFVPAFDAALEELRNLGYIR